MALFTSLSLIIQLYLVSPVTILHKWLHYQFFIQKQSWTFHMKTNNIVSEYFNQLKLNLTIFFPHENVETNPFCLYGCVDYYISFIPGERPSQRAAEHI